MIKLFNKMIDKLTIQFYTPDVAPPYAYNVNLNITNVEKGLNVDFNLQYLDREGFTEEELEEEGFSNEDNFEWKGELNKKWKDVLISSIKDVKLSDEEEGKNIFISISEDSKTREGYVKDDNLEYLVQELQQAVFEAAGRELPFTIHAKEIIKGAEVFSLSVIASFLERKAVLIKTNEVGKREETMTWENLRDLISIVFSVSYNEEEGIAEEDKLKEGFYIEPGDELWYQLPKGLENPERDFKKGESLRQMLREA